MIQEFIEIERIVIGAILHGLVKFERASEVLTAEDFRLESNRQIWRCMANLHDRSEEIDRVNVANELLGRNKLHTVGLTYLVSLEDGLERFRNFWVFVIELREIASICRKPEWSWLNLNEHTDRW